MDASEHEDAGKHPVAWVRATSPDDRRDHHEHAIAALLNSAGRCRFPMPTRAVLPVLQQPFLAGWDVEIQTGPEDLFASFLFVVSSAGSIAPCPVPAPSHSTMFALHSAREDDTYTFFAPIPEWLRDEQKLRHWGAPTDFEMRVEVGLPLKTIVAMVEDYIKSPFNRDRFYRTGI